MGWCLVLSLPTLRVGAHHWAGPQWASLPPLPSRRSLVQAAAAAARSRRRPPSDAPLRLRRRWAAGCSEPPAACPGPSSTSTSHRVSCLTPVDGRQMAMYSPTGALPSAAVAHAKLLRCPRTMPVMPAQSVKLPADSGPSHGWEPTCRFGWQGGRRGSGGRASDEWWGEQHGWREGVHAAHKPCAPSRAA